jgi:hypothetical protein
VTALVDRLTGHAELGGAIAGESGGHPFFATELALEALLAGAAVGRFPWTR